MRDKFLDIMEVVGDVFHFLFKIGTLLIAVLLTNWLVKCGYEPKIEDFAKGYNEFIDEIIDTNGGTFGIENISDKDWKYIARKAKIMIMHKGCDGLLDQTLTENCVRIYTQISDVIGDYLKTHDKKLFQEKIITNMKELVEFVEYVAKWHNLPFEVYILE